MLLQYIPTWARHRLHQSAGIKALLLYKSCTCSLEPVQLWVTIVWKQWNVCQPVPTVQKDFTAACVSAVTLSVCPGPKQLAHSAIASTCEARRATRTQSRCSTEAPRSPPGPEAAPQAGSQHQVAIKRCKSTQQSRSTGPGTLIKFYWFTVFAKPFWEILPSKISHSTYNYIRNVQRGFLKPIVFSSLYTEEFKFS